MRNAGGWICISDPELGTAEFDTFTCFHCQHIVKVAPKADIESIGSMCRGCIRMVCGRCAAGGCVPFEKKLEAIERRDAALRSYGF